VGDSLSDSTSGDASGSSCDMKSGVQGLRPEGEGSDSRTGEGVGDGFDVVNTAVLLLLVGLIVSKTTLCMKVHSLLQDETAK
jgi:hypothetical protein